MENEKCQIVVDHLVRLTQEITELKSGQQQISIKLERIEHDHGEKLGALSQGLEQNTQAIARIEHDHGEKFSALSQGLEHNTQAIARIEHDHGERLDALSQGLARIEHDHGQKLNALFDARTVQLEVNDRILATLSRIEDKIDDLSIKVAHHDFLLKNN